MTVIASEHQLFEHPVDTDTLHMTMAERYQVVIDFSRYPVGSKIVLKNQFQADPGDPFDEALTRDFWYFIAYAKDGCGNVSVVSTMTGGTLGYHLGDVSNGVTPGQLQEVLLHASIYCGLPAAVEAFRTAAEVVDAPKA